MSYFIYGRRTPPTSYPWWLKGDAPWPVAVYQPKGAADIAASRVNLANPGTYNAADGVAPTFDAATGWQFDGIDDYLTTGIVPVVASTILIRFSDAVTTGNVYMIGSNGNATTYMLIGGEGTNMRFYHGDATGIGSATRMSSGVVGIAGPKAYRDGAELAGSLSGWSGTGAILTIGALRAVSTITGYMACKIQAVVIYSTTLTAGQVAAVSAAMAAL